MKLCKKLFGKKVPTVEFYSLIPELEKLSPILYMKNIASPLMQAAARQYSTAIKNPDYGLKKEAHILKCPGIQEVVKQGFVITAWQDITIETYGDGAITWTSPIDQTNLEHGQVIGAAVEFHNRQQYTDLVEPHPNTLDSVIKFNTAWRVKIPKGYCLLETEIPYSNERRFTALTGILDDRYGSVALNVQVLWHVLKGKTVIKAGTPLARYVLVPIDEPKMLIRTPTKDDLKLERLSDLENGRKYNRSMHESKCIFSKIMNNNK